MVLLYSAVLAMAGWSVLAVMYGDAGLRPRYVVAAIAGLAIVGCLVVLRPGRLGLMVSVALCVTILTWYLLLKPSNVRDWSLEVSRCPSARIDGSELTVNNVRNFDYRSETDYTPRWEDRVYDLDRLRTADLILCYWGSKSIAHAMVSFVFDGPQYLIASIETRKERGETYSAVQGFFRQYELIYIFADERDVIRLRTNFRHEDVYVYHTTITPAEARRLLLSYLNHANALADRPEFYNALTSNCVTNVVYSAREINPAARVTWETLLSGYAARQAYRNGRLNTRLPFDVLEAKSRVNEAALGAGVGDDFSRLIRVGLPPAQGELAPAD